MKPPEPADSSAADPASALQEATATRLRVARDSTSDDSAASTIEEAIENRLRDEDHIVYDDVAPVDAELGPDPGGPVEASAETKTVADIVAASTEPSAGERGTAIADEPVAAAAERAVAPDAERNNDEPVAAEADGPAATTLEAAPDASVAAKAEEPVAAASEITADEPVATKSDDTVAAKAEEPVAAASESRADEPVVTKSDEAVAAKAEEPVAAASEIRADEPVATRSNDAVAASAESGDGARLAASSEESVTTSTETKATEPLAANSREPSSGTASDKKPNEAVEPPAKPHAPTAGSSPPQRPTEHVATVAASAMAVSATAKQPTSPATHTTPESRLSNKANRSIDVTTPADHNDEGLGVIGKLGLAITLGSASIAIGSIVWERMSAGNQAPKRVSQAAPIGHGAPAQPQPAPLPAASGDHDSTFGAVAAEREPVAAQPAVPSIPVAQTPPIAAAEVPPPTSVDSAAAQPVGATAACSINVKANVAGGAIFINGKRHGVTPAVIPTDCYATALVEIRYPHHESFKQRVKVTGDVQMAARLEREQTQLTVWSEPSGATVTYNGEVIGDTPLNVRVTKHASGHLYFRLNGYESDWRRILPKEAKQTVSITLKKRR